MLPFAPYIARGTSPRAPRLGTPPPRNPTGSSAYRRTQDQLAHYLVDDQRPSPGVQNSTLLYAVPLKGSFRPKVG